MEGTLERQRIKIRSTNMGLLSAAVRKDSLAWDQLCHIYGPLVFHWLRRQGLSREDACDISQDVFKKVFHGLGSFRRERGKFRGWLWRVTRNSLIDFRRQNGLRIRFVTGALAEMALSELEVPTEATMDSIPDCVLSRAIQLVAGDFQKKTWQMACSLLSGHSTAEELSRHYGVTPGAVYKSAARVRNAARLMLSELEENARRED